jgi:hypothetical protein
VRIARRCLRARAKLSRPAACLIGGADTVDDVDVLGIDGHGSGSTPGWLGAWVGQATALRPHQWPVVPAGAARSHSIRTICHRLEQNAELNSQLMPAANTAV